MDRNVGGNLRSVNHSYRMEFHLKQIEKEKRTWSVHCHPVVKMAETRIGVIPWYRNKKMNRK